MPSSPKQQTDFAQIAEWPSADEVHIWERCLTGQSEHDRQSALRRDLEYLTADEQARAGRFHFDKDRQVFIAARSLLRTTLSRYGDIQPRDWTFAQTALGKPFVSNGPHGQMPSFSVTHTEGYAAIAIRFSTIPVGLDVECVRRDTDLSLARRHFSAAEANYVCSQPADSQTAAFLSLWTLKESYLKAVGTGLTRPLDCVTFDLSRPLSLSIAATEPIPGGDDDWYTALWHPAPGYIAALCTERRGDGLTIRGFSPGCSGGFTACAIRNIRTNRGVAAITPSDVG